MIPLMLEASSAEEKIVKEYLEQNASEALAEKINEGVMIEKDGKRLRSRKTLAGFFAYATEEARKQAAKGATSACLHSDIVFGWVIHYFEEDSIPGTLYNEDGTEYKPPKPAVKSVSPPPQIQTQAPKQKPQMSFFDDMPEEEAADEPEPEEEEPEAETDIEEVPAPPKSETPPFFLQYCSFVEQYPNDVIAMRIGDFYEIFGLYAEQVAQVAELTFVFRDVGLGEPIEMVGFPYHKKDAYISRIRTAYSVTVIETGGEIESYPMTEPRLKINTETGEVVEEAEHDPELIAILARLLDNEIEVI